jgi:hypothetical protein
MAKNAPNDQVHVQQIKEHNSLTKEKTLRDENKSQRACKFETRQLIENP